MSKVALILDVIPDGCCECYGYDIEIDVCRFTRDRLINFGDETPAGGKPAWCPLVEIPEKKHTWDMDVVHAESLHLGECVGWNACLDDILGDKEK